jgi:N-terminal acetyltransferase B complex non-catalytic subunit
MPIKSSSASLRRSINAHKLLRYGLSAAQLTTDQEGIRAADLVREYFEALPLGNDLPKLELQPADDLAILAAQVYVNMFALDNAMAHLHNAVVLLEYALKRSPQSYQIRLELIRIYRLLGVSYFRLFLCRHLSFPLIRGTAASPGPLSSAERETDPNRYSVILSSFSRH